MKALDQVRIPVFNELVISTNQKLFLCQKNYQHQYPLTFLKHKC